MAPAHGRTEVVSGVSERPRKLDRIPSTAGTEIRHEWTEEATRGVRPLACALR